MINKNMLNHELKRLLKSKRSIWAIGIFFLLFISVFVFRFYDFKDRYQNYLNDKVTTEEIMKNSTNFSYVKIPHFKAPEILSIFHEGYSTRKGNLVYAQALKQVNQPETRSKSINLVYSEDLSVDLTFIMTFFFSLFILLISFDAINGERKKGTLRLFCTYPIPRISFYYKKMIGIFIFCSLVFTIPYIIISIFVAFAFNDITNIILYLTVYWVCCEIFIISMTNLGLLVSTLARTTHRSLIYSLLFWISFTIILPNLYDLISESFTYQDKQKSILLENKKLSEQIEDMRDYNGPKVRDKSYWIYNSTSTYHSMRMLTSKSVVEYHLSIINHFREKKFKYVQEKEKLILQKLRLKYNSNKFEKFLLFFNPITLVKSAIESISGDSFNSYLNFWQDGINLRDLWIQKGVKEGWILDERYLSWAKPGIFIPEQMEIYEKFKDASKEELIEAYYSAGREVQKDENKQIFSYNNFPLLEASQSKITTDLTSVKFSMLSLLVFNLIISVISFFKFRSMDVR